ncbi:ventral anterior homeobox 2b-like protein, partial [Leptotrombidium deliense]
SNGDEKQILLPKKLDLERPKRLRTTFTSNQLQTLEDVFARNRYLSAKEKKELSSKLKLTETQIKVWFQNRRTKQKRDENKQKQEIVTKAETEATSNVLFLLEQQHKSGSIRFQPSLMNYLNL